MRIFPSALAPVSDHTLVLITEIYSLGPEVFLWLYLQSFYSAQRTYHKYTI